MQPSTFAERFAFALWWRNGTKQRETNGELAERLDVTDGTIGHWLDRPEAVTSEQGEQLADLCDVPYEWLMRGERASVEAPELFARFLPVHRAWVRRGGGRKAKKRAPKGTRELRPKILKVEKGGKRSG